MTGVVPVIDVLAFMAFAVAFGLALTIPLSEASPVNGVAKACMLGATGCYAFAMFSNMLEHFHVTAALDPIEDHIEILYPAFILYGGYALFVRQRETELISSQRAARRSQEMLLGILDSTPAGILMVDPGGRIAFANDVARHVLDLTENAECVIGTPGWGVHVEGHDPEKDLSALFRLEDSANLGVPVTFVWPTGWRVELSLRIERLGDASGGVGGLVVTFLPPPGLGTGDITRSVPGPAPSR